ncbi:MAG: HAMP domain-containing protein [Planctomycetes bacterium]|nr:HAMP domain-containing protein [Planctomycetota bacterium]
MRLSPKLSTFQKLMIALACLSVVAACAMIVVTRKVIHRLADKVFLRKSLVEVENVAESLVRPLLTDDRQSMRDILQRLKKADEDVHYAFVQGDDARVIAHTFDGGFPQDLLGMGTLHSQSGERHGDASVLPLQVGKETVWDISNPILKDRGERVHVGVSDKEIAWAQGRLFGVSVGIHIAVFLVMFVVLYLAVGFFLRPIRDLAEASARVSEGDFSAAVEVEADDEIGMLSRSFNLMVAKVAEQMDALEKERGKIQVILDNMEEGVIYVDENNICRYVNTAAKTMLDLPDDMIGRTVCEMEFPPPVADLFECVCGAVETPDSTARRSIVLHGRHIESVCSPVTTDSGQFLGAVKVSMDVSQLMRMQQGLERSRRLAMIGELAAGVAHEINNPLDGVQNAVRIIEKDPSNEERRAEFLPLVSEGLARIQSVVQRMLSLGRERAMERTTVDVKDLIEEAETLVAHRMEKSGVTVHRRLPEEPCLMKGDARNLSGALINLLLNAIDSMPSGGEMDISLNDGKEHEGRWAIKIKDTGCGISPEDLERVFDPFFTTKPPNRGTGLGLAITQTVVREHGGTLDIHSELGIGTTVTISLPKA